jgi:hypothetical protein
MKQAVVIVLAVVAVAALRPPAVPLSANHPFFSVWSASDNLYDAPTVWGPNGDVTEMGGMVYVDGTAYRFMGKSSTLPTVSVTQTSLTVNPTQTIYEFNVSGLVQLTVTWTTAALPNDWETMARPVTYISYSASSLGTSRTCGFDDLGPVKNVWRISDGKAHSVKVYFDATGQLVTNADTVEVSWNRGVTGSTTWMAMGAVEQESILLVLSSDRIAYGYLYVAAASNAVRALLVFWEFPWP